jgi:hypothetical protein
MKVPRKNMALNDAIELFDQHLILCNNDIPTAWEKAPQGYLDFIAEEVDNCLDMRYYLENYHCITDETRNVKTMYPYWDHQEIVQDAIDKDFAEDGFCKRIVLKPRQTGLTVWTCGAMLWRTILFPNSYTLEVAQDVGTQFDIFKRMFASYNLLPWWLKPEFQFKQEGEYIEFQRKDATTRLVSPGLSSILQFTNSVKGSGVAIGKTVLNLHMSEVSRYASSEVYTADIEPSMNAPNMFGIAESTAFGREGLYYNMWRGSVDDENGWKPLFIPVYKVKKYSLPTPKKFSLNEEEKKVNDRVHAETGYQITDSFWQWRRIRVRGAIRNSGGPWTHYECYPITPDEAFQSSGLCAFDRNSLHEQSITNVCKPLWAGEISLVSVENRQINLDAIREVGDKETLQHRKKTNKDRLYIWEMPEQGQSYYVSADTGQGVEGSDFSVAEVYRAGKGREPDAQVAEWWGFITPKFFARIVAALGIMYNDAEIASEYQGPGITTGDALVSDLQYPNLYRPQHKDRITHQMSNYLHWVTNVKTRDQIIAAMNEALLEKSVVLRSEDLIDEMRDFGSFDGGKIQGQGNNDDGVMSANIGIYCLRETLAGVKSSSTASAVHTGGDPAVYGVYDGLMRQRALCHSIEEAHAIISGKVGWRVQPIMICKANTPYSLVHDGNGAESELRYKHGLPSDKILPETVNAYKASMADIKAAVASVAGGDDGDW